MVREDFWEKRGTEKESRHRRDASKIQSILDVHNGRELKATWKNVDEKKQVN